MDFLKNIDRVTIMSVARHLLTFFGGLLVASGIFDAGTVEQLSGALLTILGVFWSLFDKAQVEVRVEEAKSEAKAEVLGSVTILPKDSGL